MKVKKKEFPSLFFHYSKRFHIEIFYVSIWGYNILSLNCIDNLIKTNKWSIIYLFWNTLFSPVNFSISGTIGLSTYLSTHSSFMVREHSFHLKRKSWYPFNFNLVLPKYFYNRPLNEVRENAKTAQFLKLNFSVNFSRREVIFWCYICY